MNSAVLSMKAFVTRIRRRFNISFWCMLYNIFLVVMMVASLVFSALVFLTEQMVLLATKRVQRLFRQTEAEGGQPADNAQPQQGLSIVPDEKEAAVDNAA